MKTDFFFQVNQHWSTTIDHDEIAQVLQDCSKEARGSVAIFLYRDVLRRVPMFAMLPNDLLRDLAASLKSHSFPANEWVVREGDPGGVWKVFCEKFCVFSNAKEQDRCILWTAGRSRWCAATRSWAARRQYSLELEQEETELECWHKLINHFCAADLRI